MKLPGPTNPMHQNKYPAMPMATTTDALYASLGLSDSAIIVDVCDDTNLYPGKRIIPGAIWGGPGEKSDWINLLPREKQIVFYCSQGNSRSRDFAYQLTEEGYSASYLQGGFNTWATHKFPTITFSNSLHAMGCSRWITRDRPKIDRLACPWLIRRFIDPRALIFYAPAQLVRINAESLHAEPFDIPDVAFSHRAGLCTFDAFLQEFELNDPALTKLAAIVRAADTDNLEKSEQASGLLAISLGLSANYPDDIVLLEKAMDIYDALYYWCKKLSKETHNWPQGK